MVYSNWAPSEVTCTTDSNKEPTYEGLPIGQWLQTNTSINPDRHTLADLLTLREVAPANEWGTVTFEVPVNYDTLKSNAFGGHLILGGFNWDGDFVECCFTDCERATNGHCRLWWNINYDPPGRHSIRARLTYYDGWNRIEVTGPALSYYSKNVCRFFEGSTLYDSTGAILQAQLREKAGRYRIELRAPKGKHLKTITGVATNGMIDLDWDLRDEHGKKFEGTSFIGVFHITYPDNITTNAPAKDWFNYLGH